MKITDELTGTPVLVHPDLSDDPAQRQGQVGMVTGADLGTDDVYVSFGTLRRFVQQACKNNNSYEIN